MRGALAILAAALWAGCTATWTVVRVRDPMQVSVRARARAIAPLGWQAPPGSTKLPPATPGRWTLLTGRLLGSFELRIDALRTPAGAVRLSGTSQDLFRTSKTDYVVLTEQGAVPGEVWGDVWDDWPTLTVVKDWYFDHPDCVFPSQDGGDPTCAVVRTVVEVPAGNVEQVDRTTQPNHPLGWFLAGLGAPFVLLEGLQWAVPATATDRILATTLLAIPAAALIVPAVLLLTRKTKERITMFRDGKPVSTVIR